SVSLLKARANLPSIKSRMESSRMKLLFQIIHGHYRIDASNYISLSETMPRRTQHNHHVKPFWYITGHSKHFFFVRCIDLWNNLPERIV
ncbi:hypothetical protein HPB47_021211, partial [Ixodes persulcatus]